MNIALIGIGNLGKAILQIVEESQHEIVSTFDVNSTIESSAFVNADVIIDVTHSEAFLANLDTYLITGLPIVVGTTGWYDQMEEVKAKVNVAKSRLMYAANFSLGVNLFLRIIQQAAHLINPFEAFDIAVAEQHHTGKIDSPSGTAIKISEKILDRLERKTTIKPRLAENERVKPEELHISAVRLGSVFGQHSVFIDSAEDSIELRHTAKNRLGFARGAVESAAWLIEQTGKKGVFTIDDFLNDRLM